MINILEELDNIENRSSGIATMIIAMRELRLEPPVFENRKGNFSVVFKNHTLMTKEDRVWLNDINEEISENEAYALIYLRNNELITNGDYQKINNVNRDKALQELKGLMKKNLIEAHGVGSGSYYKLKISIKDIEKITQSTMEEIRYKEKVIQDKEKVIQEDGEMVKNKEKVVQDKEKVVQDKEKVVQEDGEMVKDKEKVIQENLNKIKEGNCIKEHKLNKTEELVLKLLLNKELSKIDLANELGYKTITRNLRNSINRLLNMNLIELTIPSKPRSKNQKYRLSNN